MQLATPSPVKLDEGKIRLALGDADTSALVLLTIVLWTFGDAVFGDREAGVRAMDPAEIWAGLNERYKVWVTEEGENKLNAMMTGLRGGLFWLDEEVFMAVTAALLEGDLGDIIATGFEDLTATEVMWAALEMELAWDSPETPEFSRQVNAFVAEILNREQEDQESNAAEIDQSYRDMLQELRDLGVPLSAIRAWDEDYARVMQELEGAA